jgi:peptidoglycan hydrolase-like protein with peptidoglycan-binding domain
MQGGDIANPLSGPLARGTWRLYGTKPEEPVVVTVPSHARETPPQQIAPVVPRDKTALARELQSELKRVGCYGGEINGVWSGSTRQAIKAFIDRVNATLPTDEPDSILLTLVRSYQGKVCGEPCPTGQRIAEGDRCVLTALAAHPKKDPPQSAPGLITDWTTRTTVARAPLIDQGEGAMALAGPTGEAPTAPTGSAGPPPLPVARKPVANTNRFGPQIFRKLDRLGAN